MIHDAFLLSFYEKTVDKTNHREKKGYRSDKNKLSLYDLSSLLPTQNSLNSRSY